MKKQKVCNYLDFTECLNLHYHGSFRYLYLPVLKRKCKRKKKQSIWQWPIIGVSRSQNYLCPQLSLHLSLHSWPAHFHCSLPQPRAQDPQKGKQRNRSKLFGTIFFRFPHNPRTGARNTADATAMRIASPRLAARP